MNEQTSLFRGHPSIMKNKNMSLDGGPSKKDSLRIIQTPIDERPDRTEVHWSIPDTFYMMIIEHPRIGGHFIDQTENQNDNNGMIVEIVAKSAIDD